jgi:putative heme-binding domain-containing protein
VVKWFEDAGIRFNNGASFQNFLAHAHEEAKFSMSPEDIVALGDVLAKYVGSRPAGQVSPKGPPRKLVQAWTTADLQPSLDQVGRARSFARGRDTFIKAQCADCHRYGDQGGVIGPDLTAVATRFKRQDILESCTEPSKVLSEQYMNTALETASGQVLIGRIIEETTEKIVLRKNPLEPETITIKKADVQSRSPSKVSPMPAGLLNTFTREEILDLLAYLESLGDQTHPNFRK